MKQLVAAASAFSTIFLLGCASTETNNSKTTRYPGSIHVFAASGLFGTSALVDNPDNVLISSGRDITIAETTAASPVDSTEPLVASQDAMPLTAYIDKDSGNSKVSFADAYTRLTVTAKLPEANRAPSEKGKTPTAMIYRERGWLSRYFMGDKYDLNLTAKIRANGYEETIPLATLSRASNKSGEIWLRDMTSNLSSFPWFLVKKTADQASTPRITIEFNGSRTYESGMAGTALQIAVTGIKMVSPEAGVVTTLSSGATLAKANAIDKALGELFAKKLSERYTSDRNLGRWAPTGGLQVVLNLPKDDGDWNGDLVSVGEWLVNFEAPRPSIFSDWYLCDRVSSERASRCRTTFGEAAKEVAKEKDAASILVFPLVKTTAGSLSIRDYLLQQTWFATAQSSFSNANEANRRAAANICTNVADTVLKLGLNSFDASMVVWAVINGMPFMPTPESKIWDIKSCTDIVRKVDDV